MLWWFAVVNAQGEAIFLHYHNKATCETMHRLYSKLPQYTITDCLEKGESYEGQINKGRYDTTNDTA